MTIYILIVDDIESHAKKIRDFILDYPFVISQWTGLKIQLKIDIISGSNAYEKAKQTLQERFEYHIIMLDENLHGESGFSLFKLIDYDTYDIYGILFSQDYENYKKVNSREHRVEFVGSKKKENIFREFLKYERDNLIEKIFGVKTQYPMFYENIRKGETALLKLDTTLNLLIDEISIHGTIKYEEAFRQINPMPIKLTPKSKQSTSIKDMQGARGLENYGIADLNAQNFVYLKKGYANETSHDAETIGILENGILRTERSTRVLSSLRGDKEKPYFLDQSFVFNPLWVIPLKDNPEKMTILNHSNRKYFVEVKHTGAIRKMYEQIASLYTHYFKTIKPS